MTFVSKSNPWLFLIQGLIYLAMGVFILIRPDITLVILTRLLGVILLVAAGILLFSANYKRETVQSLLLAEGIVSLALGLLFVLFPNSLANLFIVILGIIAFLAAMINLWMLIRLRSKITSQPFLRNMLLLIFGIFLLANPMQGQEAIAVIIGIFAVVFGCVFLYGTYRLFSSSKQD